MDQETTSSFNSVLFNLNALANARIMNARTNAKGTITDNTHQNRTVEMTVGYRNMNITEWSSVDKGVVDVKLNEVWGRIKVHTVPLVRYMGKSTEGQKKMHLEFDRRMRAEQHPPR
jgi:hypothetical protein